MHKIKDVKDIVAETVKELEKLGCKEFTAKSLRMHFDQSIQISSGWLTECLNNIDYRYDRERRVWTKKPAIQITTYIKEEIYQKVKSKLDKLEKGLEQIINSLLNYDYCKKCKKQILCSYYNYRSKGLSKLIARKDICRAHKELVLEVRKLGELINEQ